MAMYTQSSLALEIKGVASWQHSHCDDVKRRRERHNVLVNAPMGLHAKDFCCLSGASQVA